MAAPITNECPYCSQPMQVVRMHCAGCQASVEAAFPQSRLAKLPTEHQRFIELFVLSDGSLKKIAEQSGVSYPTIRSRLDKVIETLREAIIADAPSGAKKKPSGDSSAEEAARVIKAV